MPGFFYLEFEMLNHSQRNRIVTNLVVVDCSSKIPSLTKALSSIRLGDFYVFALDGDLYNYPKSRLYCGIDTSFREVGRFLVGQQIADKLSMSSKSALRVLIATDADSRGDSLAVDISEIISWHENIGRARIHGLDEESVAIAFANIEPVRIKDSWPFLTHRILDRVIECAYVPLDSKIDSSLHVDRSVSAVLGIAARESLPFSEVTLAVPASDGRDNFFCRLYVNSQNKRQVGETLSMAQDFVAKGGVFQVGLSKPAPKLKPWSYSAALINVARQTDRSIFEINNSLTHLYRSGLISYPFSECQAVSAEAIATLLEIASSNGLRFDPSKIQVFSRSGRHANESSRPLSNNVNINKPKGLSDPNSYVLSLITRNLLSCGLPFSLSKPDETSLPSWAKGLEFRRLICQRSRTWTTKPVSTKVRAIPIDELIVDILAKNKIGYPLNWLSTVDKVSKFGMFSEDACLTKKALAWMKEVPRTLLDPASASKIDIMISESSERGEGDESPQSTLARIISHLSIGESVYKALERGKV